MQDCNGVSGVDDGNDDSVICITGTCVSIDLRKTGLFEITFFTRTKSSLSLKRSSAISELLVDSSTSEATVSMLLKSFFFLESSEDGELDVPEMS